ncbi:hypothetical protein [Saliphagus infecundisoli]|uniref:Uncharacterized protein n=1 Tax=Saliphagus infecundisoli TaxID=1849069 RepID=A0ABD5QDV2_9EURY|nr:hypothetical protein [Saliphagus infecundisoli]
MASNSKLPNQVTIIGRGVPANYEISIDGAIEEIDTESRKDGTIVSGRAAEGVIETGVQRFRFSGEMANVHLVDWNGTPAPESPSTPFVHVDYGVSDRNDHR